MSAGCFLQSSVKTKLIRFFVWQKRCKKKWNQIQFTNECKSINQKCPPRRAKVTLGKIPEFHIISWYENFVERRIFRSVSRESSKTLRKMCLSAKFPHQEIRWNYHCYSKSWTNFLGISGQWIIWKWTVLDMYV